MAEVLRTPFGPAGVGSIIALIGPKVVRNRNTRLSFSTRTACAHARQTCMVRISPNWLKASVAVLIKESKDIEGHKTCFFDGVAVWILKNEFFLSPKIEKPMRLYMRYPI